MPETTASRRLVCGFTLIEVLLAVSIFSLVLVAAHSVLFGALRLRNKTTLAIEHSLELEHALATIRHDLANLALPGTIAGELQTTPTSSTSNTNERPESASSGLLGQSSPDFYTSTAVLDPYLPWGELQRVTYRLEDPTNRIARGKDLYRLVLRNLLPASTEDAPEEQWLLGGVQSILFEFYDGTQWRNDWDSTTETNKLPLAVLVRLQTLPSEDGMELPNPYELIVPVQVQAPTNTTSDTSSSTGGTGGGGTGGGGTGGGGTGGGGTGGAR
jgi:general secretion pathway protein J